MLPNHISNSALARQIRRLVRPTCSDTSATDKAFGHCLTFRGYSMMEELHHEEGFSSFDPELDMLEAFPERAILKNIKRNRRGAIINSGGWCQHHADLLVEDTHTGHPCARNTQE